MWTPDITPGLPGGYFLPLREVLSDNRASFTSDIARFFHGIPEWGLENGLDRLQGYPLSEKDMAAGETELKKALLCIATYGLYEKSSILILYLLYR